MIECETRYSCSSTERKVQIPWPINPALDKSEEAVVLFAILTRSGIKIIRGSKA